MSQIRLLQDKFSSQPHALTPDQVNYFEFTKGWKHELEHTDDIDKAKLILDDLVPASATWVDPKDLPDDAEALILMSKARNFIIANSTFSWWAAMLSNSKGVVVAPEKWYRNMDDPNDLLPHEWCTIPSYWENN